jgi:hypothetical protein
MSMAITDRLLKRLETQGPQSLEALLGAFPEASEDPCQAEALHLLLRLEKRIRRQDDGRWALAAVAQTPEQRVTSSARDYLTQLPGAGAMLDSVVNQVCEQTGFERAFVRSAIRQNFDCRGARVFKQPKGGH